MDILKPDFDLFKKKYKLGKRQILYTSLAADVHTPVSSLIKLEKESYTFLFESVENVSLGKLTYSNAIKTKAGPI